MSYVFPPSFDRVRARIFGGLIEMACAQMAAFEAGREGEYPEGWDIVLPRFSAHEMGGGTICALL